MPSKEFRSASVCDPAGEGVKNVRLRTEDGRYLSHGSHSGAEELPRLTAVEGKQNGKTFELIREEDPQATSKRFGLRCSGGFVSFGADGLRVGTNKKGPDETFMAVVNMSSSNAEMMSGGYLEVWTARSKEWGFGGMPAAERAWRVDGEGDGSSIDADVASGEESRLTQFGFEPSDETVQPRALGGAKNNKENLTFLEVSRQNQKKLKQEAKRKSEGGEAKPKTATKKKKKDPDAPKGKRTAFMFYSAANRDDMKSQHPEAAGKDISTLLGNAWNLLDADMKARECPAVSASS